MQILAASNNPDVGALVRRVAAHLGHQVQVVENGSLAWQACQTASVDVLMCDYNLPGLTSIELFRRVRLRTPGSTYAYLLFAAPAHACEQTAEAMAVGADEYLLLPLDSFELGVRLKAAERVISLYRQVTDQRHEIDRLSASLFGQVRLDPLTGLGNRMRLQEDFEVLRSQSRRYGYSFSLVLFHVDQVQQYIARFGTTAGDDVLRTVAHLTLATCRGGDTAYRYGAAQFLVLLPEQRLDSAAFVAERLRAAVEEVGIPHPDNPPSDVVTVSLGVTTLMSTDAPNISVLLQQVDTALHQAARLGGNRVQAFQPEIPQPALLG